MIYTGKLLLLAKSNMMDGLSMLLGGGQEM